MIVKALVSTAGLDELFQVQPQDAASTAHLAGVAIDVMLAVDDLVVETATVEPWTLRQLGLDSATFMDPFGIDVGLSPDGAMTYARLTPPWGENPDFVNPVAAVSALDEPVIVVDVIMLAVAELTSDTVLDEPAAALHFNAVPHRLRTETTVDGVHPFHPVLASDLATAAALGEPGVFVTYHATVYPLQTKSTLDSANPGLIADPHDAYSEATLDQLQVGAPMATLSVNDAASAAALEEPTIWLHAKPADALNFADVLNAVHFNGAQDEVYLDDQVTLGDVAATVHTGSAIVIKGIYSDSRLGDVFIEEYGAPIDIRGDLQIPGIGAGFRIDDVRGNLQIPGIGASGNVDIGVDVKGNLHIPGIGISGQVDHGIAVAGNLQIPGIGISGTVSVGIDVVGNVQIPGIGMSGAVTENMVVSGSVQIPGIGIKGRVLIGSPGEAGGAEDGDEILLTNVAGGDDWLPYP